MTMTTAFMRWFNEDDTFAESVIDAVNNKGMAYFGSGYVAPHIDLDEARDQLRTYTKSAFSSFYEELTNTEYDEELLHTAVSDSFRHAVVIDMSEPSTPVVLSIMDPRFDGMTEDRVFTWAGVAALAAAYPMMFVLHTDTEDTMLFNIPIAN
jgi:hypothetical protein